MNARSLELSDTAWRRFEIAQGRSLPSPFEQLLRSLEEAAVSHNLEPAMIRVAAELATTEPDLALAEQCTLLMIIVATLLSLTEGSTRLPVDGNLGRAELERLLAGMIREVDGDVLEALGATQHDKPLAGWLALRTGLLTGRARHTIGDQESDYRPLIYQRPYLYHHQVLQAEMRLADRIAQVLRRPSFEAANLSEAMADVEARAPIRAGKPVALSSEQADVIRMVARAPLSMVSGGPGTGKTSTVVALLRTLVRLGIAPEEIALAAPTGKAAYRMGESIRLALALIPSLAEPDLALVRGCPEPLTLHRLLGSTSGGRFRHHAGNRLAEAVVIIDESSMLDIYLMERLISSLGTDARLVLLGDADQLPSVAAGAVFRDLLRNADDAAAPTARLTHSYRMDASQTGGRSILTVARRINRGNTRIHGHASSGIPLVQRRETRAELTHIGVERIRGDVTQRAELLDAWYADWCSPITSEATALSSIRRRTFVTGEGTLAEPDRAALDAITEHLGRARILTLTRNGPTGSVAVNQALHTLAAQEMGLEPWRTFLVGEPVMMRHNDYDRGLFNGDQGVIVWMAAADEPRSRRLAVAFPRLGSYVWFPLATLAPHLELCYAMTVHKSQGSEFDRVVVMLPERDMPLLTRELLYTAITRARQAVMLVGRGDLLIHGVRRRINRHSGLAERLELAARAEAQSHPS